MLMLMKNTGAQFPICKHLQAAMHQIPSTLFVYCKRFKAMPCPPYGTPSASLHSEDAICKDPTSGWEAYLKGCIKGG